MRWLLGYFVVIAVLVVVASSLYADDLIVNIGPPTTYADGKPITDMSGITYRVYYSGPTTGSIGLTGTEGLIKDVQVGEYTIEATASEDTRESERSDPVVFTVIPKPKVAPSKIIIKGLILECLGTCELELIQ